MPQRPRSALATVALIFLTIITAGCAIDDRGTRGGAIEEAEAGRKGKIASALRLLLEDGPSLPAAELRLRAGASLLISESLEAVRPLLILTCVQQMI